MAIQVRAQSLRPGDRLIGTPGTIISVGQPYQEWRGGPRRVTVTWVSAKGRQRVSAWGPDTMINVERNA